jgi:hypothetical protein
MEFIFLCLKKITFFLVLEIKTEKIKPQLDGTSFDDSTEFRFNIPASSDYFTRFCIILS